MSTETKGPSTVVIGAGPVGALAALYAAQRGHEVEIYELRGDPRDPETTPLNFTKSINLALSERGINAMKCSGPPHLPGELELLEKVFSETIPMRGRMIHGKDKSGEFSQQAQDYDIRGRTLFAVDRGDLNRKLLDELESLPNVKFFFNHKLTGADFKKHKAWLENTTSPLTDSPSARHQEIEISFDLLIGCDGAHSAARYHMMKYTRMDYKQEYIDTLWCEFTIPTASIAKPSGLSSYQRFRISPNHLHIWPGKDFMFIAIPSFDGSFTCTLFMPSSRFSSLSADPKSLPSFFQTHFPGVCPELITEAALIDSFTQNPHLPLISITCSPYHYTDSAVILGDAAHAMVPFYGQGMNAGLEDVHVLFSLFDEHQTSRAITSEQRAAALQAYSTFRTPDAHAINALALQNYIEMRSSVTSPSYLARKWLEEKLSIWVPSLGWSTKYSRVSFGNERYSEVVKLSERQGRVLGWVMSGVGSGILVGAVCLGVKLRWVLKREFWGL